MMKQILVLSEQSDYGLDRSLAWSLGLRGPTEYEWESLVPINTRAVEMTSSNRMNVRTNGCKNISDRTSGPFTIADRFN